MESHFSGAGASRRAGTRRRQQPEQLIQRALIAHLGWRAPKNVWFAHYASGGWRTPVEGAILKGMGVRPGTPDLLIGRLFALELKSAAGRLSVVQIDCHRALREAGATVGVASSIDDALAILAEWDVLPGAAS